MIVFRLQIELTLSTLTWLLILHNYRLDKNLSVKVADFGLSRDVYVEDYYKMQGDTPLPVKWLAPEALFDREFSVKTDVVSN